MVGCGGMWQGVGACGRGSGRVWGYVVWVQAYSLDGDMWWGWAMWQGVGACGRVWGHVVGGGGMSQGIGTYGRGWGGDMWQGVGAGGGGMW